MSVASAPMGRPHDDGSRAAGWHGLSGTAGSQDPALPPLPDIPSQRGRERGRHTSGVAVSEYVLRDGTGPLATAGAVVTAGGRIRRHDTPVTATRTTTGLRATTATVLASGTALGVVGAVAGPLLIPPVDDSPRTSPEFGAPPVAPVPAIPAPSSGPDPIAFDLTADALGLPSTPRSGSGPAAGASPLPSAPVGAAPAALGGTGAAGGGAGAGGGVGAGAPAAPVPTPGGLLGLPGGSGGSAGGGAGGSGTRLVPLVPAAGGLVTDTGDTARDVLPAPVGPVVGGVTDTVGGVVGTAQRGVVAPVGETAGGVVDGVGAAAAPLPLLGGTLHEATDTVSDVATVVTGGGEAPSAAGLTGTAEMLVRDGTAPARSLAPRPVTLTQRTAAQFLDRAASTASTATGAVTQVGEVTRSVPAAGRALQDTTDTVAGTVGVLVDGAREADDDAGPSSGDDRDDDTDDTSSSDVDADEDSDGDESDGDESGGGTSDVDADEDSDGDESDGGLLGPVAGLLGASS